MSAHLLTCLLAVPTFGALIVLFAPRQSASAIRSFSLLVTSLVFVLSLGLLKGDYSSARFAFVEHVPWVPTLGIAYKVGVDGISLWLVLLTTLLTPIALLVSWSSVRTKIKEYVIAFLLLETGMLGAFVALDLFVFYVFWELMLIPMVLIIGVWGGSDRVYAAVKFFLFTLVGSLLMLAAILYLAVSYRALAGHLTFDLQELSRVVLPRATQAWLFAAFGLAFAVKVPMFPFHTWLPDAHVQAPTGGSVILAAVLLKLGTYGFLRFAMPLFPWASHMFGTSIAVLAVVGIVYGAYCAWAQADVKKLVAYSSVSHLGFVLLGMFAMNQSAVSGSILQMVNHGISTGALFILVGVIYDRLHTRDLGKFGGLAGPMPLYATLFVVIAMSSIGLPGTNGFVGEFMILSSTWFAQAYYPWMHNFVLFGAVGVILAAIYMLHAVLKMFWGAPSTAGPRHLLDLNLREGLALMPLVALVFWIGLYPAPFLRRMEPSVDHFVKSFQLKLQWVHRDDSRRLLPVEINDAQFRRPSLLSLESSRVQARSKEAAQ